jgi:hypothetical protein
MASPAGAKTYHGKNTRPVQSFNQNRSQSIPPELACDLSKPKERNTSISADMSQPSGRRSWREHERQGMIP